MDKNGRKVTKDLYLNTERLLNIIRKWKIEFYSHYVLINQNRLTKRIIWSFSQKLKHKCLTFMDVTTDCSKWTSQNEHSWRRKREDSVGLSEQERRWKNIVTGWRNAGKTKRHKEGDHEIILWDPKMAKIETKINSWYARLNFVFTYY